MHVFLFFHFDWTSSATEMDLTQLKNLNWDLSKFTVDEVTTIKGELKKHGQHLQQQIQKMIQDYRQTDLDPEYLATASSDINAVEAKASNYVSRTMSFSLTVFDRCNI